jgi:NADH dehydrogenase
MIERREELVTVFGGDGFIGRYVCEFLMKAGVRVRVASRDPRNSYFIQPLSQVGQLGVVRADVRSPVWVKRALESATAAINLTGLFGRQMHAVHVEGARNVAIAARDQGCDSVVHVSAIGADPESASEYGRTKGEGETAIRKSFPKATIFRPSLVFGPEDKLTNRFASMAELPILPVIAAKRNFQPVYVRDLAQAIARAVLEPQKHGGKTYEIGGPQILSMIQLHQAIIDITGQKPELIPLPDIFGSLLSRFGWLPGAPLTRDQWLMLCRDNVPSGELPGLDAFGIKPTPLAAVADEWLGRFRKGGKLAGRRFHLTAAS